MGTAPYMSPEQIRGRDVDKRSDVWAFGCLLFELLSGQRPFHRETMADTLSAILEHEPDWGALPAGTPASVRQLVQRCLKKDASMRLQDIADGCVTIDEALQSGMMPPMTRPDSSPKGRRRIATPSAAGVAVLLLIGLLSLAYWMGGGELVGGGWPETLRISLTPTEGAYPMIGAGIAELIEQEIGISVERVDPRTFGGRGIRQRARKGRGARAIHSRGSTRESYARRELGSTHRRPPGIIGRRRHAVGRFTQDELLEAYEVYKKTRERIDAGELWWDKLRDFFTQDAVFVDPAWGRVDGIDNIVKFLEDSMRGLEDWTFPLEWMAVDGDYLITGWQNRLPGRRADGTYYQVPGMSRLRYAGDGRFSYEQDLINMVHMLEVMKESGWKPRDGFQNPPRDRIRLCAWAP